MADGPAVQTVELAKAAYVKMMLHAAKHPASAVNGAFVGRREGDRVVLEDCVPLFHSPLNLSPMLEVALLKLDAHCSTAGKQIAGYYQANENVASSKMDHVFSTILGRVSANNADAVGVMVQNDKLTRETLAPGGGFTVFFPVGDKKWHPWSGEEDGGGADGKGFVVKMGGGASEAGGLLVQLLAAGAEEDLVDFDAHLDDVSLDYLNPALAGRVK